MVDDIDVVEHCRVLRNLAVGGNDLIGRHVRQEPDKVPGCQIGDAIVLLLQLVTQMQFIHETRSLREKYIDSKLDNAVCANNNGLIFSCGRTPTNEP